MTGASMTWCCCSRYNSFHIVAVDFKQLNVVCDNQLDSVSDDHHTRCCCRALVIMAPSTRSSAVADTDRAMLRVIEWFAKSLKLVQLESGFLFSFHST